MQIYFSFGFHTSDDNGFGVHRKLQQQNNTKLNPPKVFKRRGGGTCEDNAPQVMVCLQTKNGYQIRLAMKVESIHELGQ